MAMEELMEGAPRASASRSSSRSPNHLLEPPPSAHSASGCGHADGPTRRDDDHDKLRSISSQDHAPWISFAASLSAATTSLPYTNSSRL